VVPSTQLCDHHDHQLSQAKEQGKFTRSLATSAVVTADWAPWQELACRSHLAETRQPASLQSQTNRSRFHARALSSAPTDTRTRPNVDRLSATVTSHGPIGQPPTRPPDGAYCQQAHLQRATQTNGERPFAFARVKNASSTPSSGTTYTDRAVHIDANLTYICAWNASQRMLRGRPN
jgi:hypothetical protein